MTRHAGIATAVAATLLAVPAAPNSIKGQEQGETQRTPPAEPGLTGDWGGLRTRLVDDGVTFTARYTSESAYNFTGGDRQLWRETGQFDVGAVVDTGKLFGLNGGTFTATVTSRRGYDLVAAAGLETLQLVQEVFGRGQTTRLTQFWYEHKFGSVAIKAGRVAQGEDFGDFTCYFQNLTFCGSLPGNLVGEYWYNWPISQWGARIKVSGDNGSVQAGIYEVNPRNLENDFTIGKFDGATGVLLPVQLTLTPKLGPNGLLGSYKLGGWYATNDGDDVFLDLNHAPQTLTGATPLRRNERYGVFAILQQQLTGTVKDGKVDSGLVVFFNITQADRRTATIDNQIAAGLFYKGIIPQMPLNTLGVAVGRTQINGRVARGQRLDPARPEVQDAEYVAEIFYSLHPASWLTLRPNFQYIVNPGGRKNRADVGVLGLKATLTL